MKNKTEVLHKFIPVWRNLKYPGPDHANQDIRTIVNRTTIPLFQEKVVIKIEVTWTILNLPVYSAHKYPRGLTKLNEPVKLKMNSTRTENRGSLRDKEQKLKLSRKRWTRMVQRLLIWPLRKLKTCFLLDSKKILKKYINSSKLMTNKKLAKWLWQRYFA